MKQLRPWLLATCAALFLFTIAAGPGSVSKTPANAAQRADLWKAVETAEAKKLPQTAIEALERILAGAAKDRAYAEWSKALAKKIVLEGEIQGDKPEERITRMEAALASAPKEVAPLLETLLAEWYWNYFQINRWHFMQRTATAEPPGDDIQTWDLPRIFAEIDRHFQKALASAPLLKTIPVTTFEPLLRPGIMPDACRPTLFDFIAQEALAFYSSGEQAATVSQDAFEIEATSPIFDPVEKFLAWVPDTADVTSPKFKAVKIYQELLRFHQGDQDPTAFIDANLARTLFGKNVAVGEEVNERCMAALKALVDQYADHPLSALARHHWASILKAEGRLSDAHAIAAHGAKVFAESPGGILCSNLLIQIEAREMGITTERVWNRPWPDIAVRYRNVTHVHFRAIPMDWLKNSKNMSGGEDHMVEPESLLNEKPAYTWSAVLPATPDFQERMEVVPAPDKLKPGFYFILASHDPSFRKEKNQLSSAGVWVSDLALVYRWKDKQVEGFVLTADTGEPVSGAAVEARLAVMGADWKKVEIKEFRANTDEFGRFELPIGDHDRANYLLLLAQHETDQVGAVLPGRGWGQGHRDNKPVESTVLFTDRALYRPGQTIRYKGICVSVNHGDADYKVLTNQTVTVVFVGASGKEIARQQHRCNDYGSFAGSFTAPRDQLMGRMTLRTEGGPRGHARVNVEEYKRPKFRVTLQAPSEAPRLNGRIHVTGLAEAYTGAAVDGAQVSYRVVRQVRWPSWFAWFRAWLFPNIADVEIAHGKGRTGTDGKFEIVFDAKPDRSISPENEPVFVFRVYADITDSAGETRSGELAVNVGYTALQASLSADQWLTADRPVDVRVATSTLDGVPQDASGIVRIHRLKEPAAILRPRLTSSPEKDPFDPNTWPLADAVSEMTFATSNGTASVAFSLGEGLYRAVLETKDRWGKKVTALLPLYVLQPDANRLGLKVPFLFHAPTWSAEPGDEFMALWGTGYDQGRAFIEIEHDGQVLQRYWTKPGVTQAKIRQDVKEAFRGGFTLRVTQVRANRLYTHAKVVEVPWNNKNLTIKWEHFTSKLGPGQKETWTAVITGPKAEHAVAEMAAVLYDESLDAFLQHQWPRTLVGFRKETASAGYNWTNPGKQLRVWARKDWNPRGRPIEIRYRDFLPELVRPVMYFGSGIGGGYEGMRRAGSFMGRDSYANYALAPMAVDAAMPQEGAMAKSGEQVDSQAGGMASAASVDLSQVAARKNLEETAFFFPQLTSDSQGVVRLTFTMPEALTQWKFMGLAHDAQLRSGWLEDHAVTAKDLMVQPNPPRFLREGDVLEFTVKVSNQSAARQAGKVRLGFTDARTGESVDAQLGLAAPELDFDVPAKESRSFSWKISVPDGMGFLAYKAVGSTGRLSDGEEGYLPVLSRRILVTESLPLPVRGPTQQTFRFKRLLDSGASKTLRHQSLTVQMVSQPAWYAVMALPYLMEYPYECSEQIFNRLYANALARHIANADPKIRRVFDQWKATPALDSPLEKNEDLKSVALEETPWVRQAESESEARRNVGILFDANRLDDEAARMLNKLTAMQIPDGRWPWFAGGQPNEFITLYIVTGFGRLRHLGVEMTVDPAIKALAQLDSWINERYREILKNKAQDGNHLTPSICLYLYGRSFFLKDRPVPAEAKEAVDYFLGQGRTNWTRLDARQSLGHLALGLKRFGDQATATDIMKSIREHAVTDAEMGMFWRDTERSWWWYRAPIETQALMIEAFDEVLGDTAAVEECRVWLLKQKQTQNWKTTKATADAVYALLLRGADLLASDALVEVSLGGQAIRPEKVEAGTGFYEKRFPAAQIKPALGNVAVKKTDPGVAWGSVHWQYLEDMTRVTPYAGTPLKLKKALFVKVNTKQGPVLKPVTGPLAVGDELVVRVELRTDRDMEYVHLKDQRGSGLEPVNVLSGYRYRDGLRYYESTRDTASHFFIDYLPKGVYVFEYSARVQHRGRYQSGMAEIQCMYAPEFNSHSESFNLIVQ